MNSPVSDPRGHGPGAGPRRSNLRTALVLLSIAAMFFVGVVAKRWLFG